MNLDIDNNNTPDQEINRPAIVPNELKCVPVNMPCCKKNRSCCPGTHKLEVYDWLNDIPLLQQETQMVEVQFKNTRKGYFLNSNNIEVNRGDIVAVESTPGHDIGEVVLTGKLVKLQMLKNNFRGEVKRIYRIAKPSDIEKSNEAKAKEHKTMLRAREIAEDMKLNMKISDVEYQGDGNKAIFYYIADERVDFRQLIKVYASEFRVKIEMKQIGARQEAGRVGGIGPCGRPLCCSSSMSNFVSVSTSAARLQDISLNPQKLAGQCGKLKCCLNFEVDTYVEAQRSMPNREIPLETKDSTFYHFKSDILSGQMIYSTDKHFAANLVTIDKDRAYEIVRMNRIGKKPLQLKENVVAEDNKVASLDVLEQESISRFDNKGSNPNKRRKKKIRPKQENASEEKKEPRSIKLNKRTDKQENNNIKSSNPINNQSEINSERKENGTSSNKRNRPNKRYNKNHSLRKNDENAKNKPEI